MKYLNVIIFFVLINPFFNIGIKGKKAKYERKPSPIVC